MHCLPGSVFVPTVVPAFAPISPHAMEVDQASKFVTDLLQLMLARKGSDLFLTADFPPAIKQDGKVVKLSPQALTPAHTVQLARAVMSRRGLVVLAGGTGSGKTTTMAAMVDWRNENAQDHIVTVEDPIEFVHHHKNSIVTQREVGLDTEGWAVALKNSLRQAPDVILMGEIRDRETMDQAIALSETGHLCLATLHANNANQALDRIVNFFPEERRPQLLMDLSLNVRAIVSQRLLARESGQGRVAAVEILLNSPLITDLIFKGEVAEVKEVMKRSREIGMQTFDQALFDLYEANAISYEDAVRNADSVNDLRLQIKLNGKRSSQPNLTRGTEHLKVMKDTDYQALQGGGAGKTYRL